MRCLFNTAAKDVRRFRLYEKSLDALATSPYARTVDRWLLAGTCLLGADFAQTAPLRSLELHNTQTKWPTYLAQQLHVGLFPQCRAWLQAWGMERG